MLKVALFVGTFLWFCGFGAAITEVWDPTPLGEVMEPVLREPDIRNELVTRRREYRVMDIPLVLVREGRAEAAVVIPASRSLGARESAELLVEMIHRATGVRLPLLAENEVEQVSDSGYRIRRIADGEEFPFSVWIGDCVQTESAGVTVETLAPEGYVIRSIGNGLFLRGNLQAPQGFTQRIRANDYAVIDLLENYLGIRWLWPGELGTVVPERKSIVIPALHITDEPALKQRYIRNIWPSEATMSAAANALNVLESTADHYRQTLVQQSEWLRLMRMGATEYQAGGHMYTGWYDQYHETHPEWFALQPDGTRIQFPRDKVSRERLCVSNPELAREIANRIIQQYQENPHRPGGVGISPNDGGGYNFFCMCESCRKLDPVNGQLHSLMFAGGSERLAKDRYYLNYPSLSDRYALFYNRIATYVTAEIPEAKLVALAYHVYSDAPLGVEQIHPAITIGFVRGNYLSARDTRDMRKQWDAWASLASRLYYRPNVLHTGNGIPFNYARAMGKDLQHYYQTGMIGVDYDSLIGHWATQGLNYYVLAKLLWDPSLDVDELIEDYCRSGFGEAWEYIRLYLASLEQLTEEFANLHDLYDEEKAKAALMAEERDQEVDTRALARPFSRAYVQVFTPERMVALREMLREARQAVEGDEVLLKRIDFLEYGLDYAEARIPLESLLAAGDSGRGQNSLQVREELVHDMRKLHRQSPQSVNAVRCIQRDYYFLQNWKTN